jgi:hypothetical protein
LRFLCKPIGLFHRFRTESLVSDSSPFSFLKRHVFKSLLTQIDFIVVEKD